MSKWGPILGSNNFDPQPVALSKRAVPGLFFYHFTYCFSIWKTCAHMYVTKKWTHSHDIVKPSIHGFRSYHIYHSKWRIWGWQCFQKFHVRSPPLAETSLLLRATGQLILGSGFSTNLSKSKRKEHLHQTKRIEKYFPNKYVSWYLCLNILFPKETFSKDSTFWICFMTGKPIWNPSSFKTCQKNDVKTYTVMDSFSLSRLHHPKTPPSEIRGVWTQPMAKWLRSPFI